MANKLYEALESRILLLDGGFGTMVQQYGFTEEDYRGERFRDWNVLLKGCNDLLAVTRPGAVREIHVKYLQAGAYIIETDSFNANAVSWRARWARPTARPRCRPTSETPQPAR